ncbi:hypothetical protein [Brevundimonas sp.]|uniref:hypothetical protein n=1 Tax=Brevundimonas sp. TaxID=1871086 RepID=UPI001A26B56B|nr:hypothetical protein [Brevundimonas sp.]MBJ7486392.1 hypothetical protein [Brevundimonas sp.]
MSRPTTVRPPSPVDDRGTPEFERLKRELERRLGVLRVNIAAKRRDCGLVEIEEGVWIRPDPTDAPSPNE